MTSLFTTGGDFTVDHWYHLLTDITYHLRVTGTQDISVSSQTPHCIGWLTSRTCSRSHHHQRYQLNSIFTVTAGVPRERARGRRRGQGGKVRAHLQPSCSLTTTPPTLPILFPSSFRLETNTHPVRTVRGTFTAAQATRVLISTHLLFVFS